MPDQAAGGGFAIAAGDADHLRIGVPAGELDLGYHPYSPCQHLLHQWGAVGYSGALYDLIGLQHPLFGMSSLFKSDLATAKRLPVVSPERSTIGEKHLQPFLLCQDGRSHPAFSATQYHQSFTFHLALHFVR